MLSEECLLSCHSDAEPHAFRRTATFFDNQMRRNLRTENSELEITFIETSH